MPTRQKAKTIDQLSDQLTRANLVIVTDYRGLKVTDLQTLRGNLRPSGAEIHVAKNTLTRIAAGNAGVVGLDPLLEGPSALVFSFEDAVQTAKAVSDFVRTSRILSVKGGVMGDRTVTAADVEAIATLPSREELQARLLGMLVSPMARTSGRKLLLPWHLPAGRSCSACFCSPWPSRWSGGSCGHRAVAGRCRRGGWASSSPLNLRRWR
jgi:large subunit ribosomal protein L10